MGRIEFFDHLNARTTVVCDLVNVSPLHQAHRYISMAEAVRRARLRITIEFQGLLFEDVIKSVPGVFREELCCREQGGDFVIGFPLGP